MSERKHEHEWVPMGSIVNFGGKKPDYQMRQGCVCGAYRWVKAREELE